MPIARLRHLCQLVGARPAAVKSPFKSYRASSELPDLPQGRGTVSRRRQSFCSISGKGDSRPEVPRDLLELEDIRLLTFQVTLDRRVGDRGFGSSRGVNGGRHFRCREESNGVSTVERGRGRGEAGTSRVERTRPETSSGERRGEPRSEANKHNDRLVKSKQLVVNLPRLSSQRVQRKKPRAFALPSVSLSSFEGNKLRHTFVGMRRGAQGVR